MMNRFGITDDVRREGADVFFHENSRRYNFIPYVNMRNDKYQDQIEFLNRHPAARILISVNSGFNHPLDRLSKLNQIYAINIDGEHKGADFLQERLELRYLHLPRQRGMFSLRRLVNLRVLSLHGSNFCDYDALLQLRGFSAFNWGSDSADIRKLSASTHLASLSLNKTNISTLNGISEFLELRELDVYAAPKLVDISDLERMPDSRIDRIQFERCANIKDWSVLGAVKSVRHLLLISCGKMETLEFVRSLPKIQYVAVPETKILDGNLAKCFDNPSLRAIGFLNSKSYDLRAEDAMRHEFPPPVNYFQEIDFFA
jgi:hypothetical protein